MTILNCRFRGSTQNFKGIEVIKYLVKYLITSAHIDPLVMLDKCAAQFHELDRSVAECPLSVDIDETRVTGTWSFAKPREQTISVGDFGTFEINTTLISGTRPTMGYIEWTPFIRLTPREPRNLAWNIKALDRLRNLLTILHGEQAVFTHVFLFNGTQRYKLYFGQVSRRRTYRKGHARLI